ncbi:MAG: ABC transporter ATP-binding protein [Firmicutes bacterium]|nr:ABC transporter ATP-binding protein [Bacillota bacterium]
MNRLLKYLRDYRKESILAPLFKMLEASFELLVPLVVSRIIDVGIVNHDTPLVIRMVLILAAFAAVGLVCSLTAQYFAARAAVGFTAKVKSALFRHIQSLSYTELDTLGTSTLITRLTSDMNQVQNGINLVLRLFLRSPFIVFGAMIMAFTIDTQAALIFVVAIPVLSAVVFGIMLISMPLYKKVQAGLDRVLLRTRENLNGVRVIRAFNKEQDEIHAFDEEHGKLTGLQLYVGRISALMNPLTYVIINAAILILIWTGAWKVEGGVLTQGQVVALINYMSQILVELVKLANLIITVTKAVACGNRVQAVFDIQPGMTYPDALSGEAVESDSMISFENAGLAYHEAGAEALTGIDLKIRKGETIGIIGGTGSGKSSLVNLIPRFYDVTSGRVMLDGRDVREYPEQELRSRIGIVPQKAELFQGTVADNLRFRKEDATEEEMWEALRVAQAAEFVESREGGLQAAVSQNGRNLSGGQRQRLTIARALVGHPGILILDDSASALDYATDAKLRQSIRRMDPSVTVLIVSQRTASIRHADRIVVLDDGEIVGIGRHEELMENCSVYQEIYYSQFPKEVPSNG